MEKLRKLLIQLIWLFACFLFSAIAFFIFINSNHYLKVAKFKLPIVFLFLFLVVTFIVILIHCLNNYKYTTVIIVWIVGLFILQVIIAKFGHTRIGWDVFTIIEQANDLKEEWNLYFAYFPNNRMLTYLLMLLFNLTKSLGITNIWLVAIMANILIIDITLIFVVLLSNKYYGKKGAIISMVLSTFLFALHPNILVPYSDTFGMCFSVISIFCIERFKQEKTAMKYVWLFFASFSFIFGFYIKPVILIPLIAIIIVFFLKERISLHRKLFLPSLACIAVITTSIFFADAIRSNAQTAVFTNPEVYYKEFLKTKEIPLHFYFAMGLNEQKSDDGKYLYGSYNADDYTIISAINGYEEKVVFSVKHAQYRLKNMGFLGYLQHSFHKFIWTNTDGTFLYGFEGSFHHDSPRSTEGISGFIHEFTYPTSYIYQNYYSNYLQAVWLLIIILCTIASYPKGNDDKALIETLSILGLMLFLVLFETRARYLFIFTPLYVILATKGLLRFFKFLEDKELQAKIFNKL
jgi:hypothetical protein